MEESHRPYSIFWPLLLIAAGVFLLLNALGLIEGDFWGTFLKLWPLLFIAGGLDSLYRRESFVGPILFIGIGSVILLSNLGYMELASWTVFLRLWPVLLIAFGLDILIGHRSAWSAVLGVVMGLLLVAGVFWYASTLPAAQAGRQSEAISQDLQGAEQASLKLEQIFGELVVRGGAGGGNLIEGEVQLGRNQTFSQDYRVSNGRGTYSLDSSSADAYVPFLNPATSLVWHLNLTESIPLSLETNLVIGLQNVDVSGLTLDRFDTNVVIGQNTLVIGEDDLFEGRTSVVIGQIVIKVPRDVPLRLQLNTALTGTNYPDDFTRDENVVFNQAAGQNGPAIELELNMPMGSVLVEYVD
jgi:hypothetical protein